MKKTTWILRVGYLLMISSLCASIHHNNSCANYKAFEHQLTTPISSCAALARELGHCVISWEQGRKLIEQWGKALHALLGSTVAAAAQGTSVKLILLKSRSRCLGKK